MRLVLLHGFTQSPDVWDQVRVHLDRGAAASTVEVAALTT